VHVMLKVISAATVFLLATAWSIDLFAQRNTDAEDGCFGSTLEIACPDLPTYTANRGLAVGILRQGVNEFEPKPDALIRLADESAEQSKKIEELLKTIQPQKKKTQKKIEATLPQIEENQDVDEVAPPQIKPKQSVVDVADQIGLRNGIYDYIVIDQDLTVALLEFARNFKVQVDIDTEVRGRLRDRLPPSTGEEFLNQLAEQNQFDWFLDGRVLRVTPLRQTTSRVFNSKNIKIEDLRSALARLGVSDRRHPLRTDELTGLTLVSGPPRFIALVEAAITALKKKKAEPEALPSEDLLPENPTDPVSEIVAPPIGKSVIVHKGSETSEVNVD
jgi:type III secretion protein C